MQKVVITNTTKSKRTFQIKADIEQCSLEGCTLEYVFQLEESSTMVETVKVEEEVEKLEHKLRIAQRKEKTEKVIKLNKKIQELRNELETGSPSVVEKKKDASSTGSAELPISSEDELAGNSSVSFFFQ